MKKMFLTLALTAATTAAMAQQSVSYFRVQFSENLEQVKTYAADGKTFFNPAYDYLDFKGSLPFTHSSLSGNVDENAYYYIGTAPNDKTKFTLAKTDGSLAIKKVSAYSQPVETITVTEEEGTYAVNGKKQFTYTFNALPRNIEELKTLEVENRKYFDSQYFVTALFICCLNRIADNSADAWEMINYLRTHTATVGQNGISLVSNLDMQNIVQSNLVGKDTNGFPVVNGLRSFFAGSSPENLYTPTTPYKVTVVEAAADPIITENGTTYAKLHVISSGADSAQGPLTLRKTNNHGWLIWDGEKAFTMSKKAQKEDL